MNKYYLLNILNVLNFKWNCWIGWIHDVSARWGVGHTTVWFYDTFTWYLPTSYKLIGDKPYNEYLLQCELDTANHQIRYYSNLAFEYQLAYLETLISDENSELIYENKTTIKNEHKIK